MQMQNQNLYKKSYTRKSPVVENELPNLYTQIQLQFHARVYKPPKVQPPNKTKVTLNLSIFGAGTQPRTSVDSVEIS